MHRPWGAMNSPLWVDNKFTRGESNYGGNALPLAGNELPPVGKVFLRGVIAKGLMAQQYVKSSATSYQ